MKIELLTRTRENVIHFFHEAQDAEIKALLPQKAKSEGEALAAFEQSLLPTSTSCGRCIYADGEYVGDIWAYCLGCGEPDAMLSFCVFRKALWGKGIAAEALRLFIGELRKKYAVHTLGAFTFADNAASIKVLLKNGFREIESFTEDGRESWYFQTEI